MPTETPEALAVPSAAELHGLMGFIVEDDGAMPTYMMMHGFLHTAENLGHPARIYRARAGAEAEEAVRRALSDGCKAVLIAGAAGKNDAAVQAAIAAGLYTAVPYEPSAAPGLHVNVTADTEDYIEELIRGLAERMGERSLRSGRILIYGVGTEAVYGKISAVLAESYPQFQAVPMERRAAGQAAVDELTQYLLANRDIKGLYATDHASAPLVVQARNKAISLFKEGGAAAYPQATPLSGPEPNPELLKQISVTVFGCGLSDENLRLFQDNDIYGLCIEPYYEAAANSTMQLDNLLLGEAAQGHMRVNRPIVYADTIDKYLAIYEQVQALFGLTPTPEAEPDVR